VYAEEVLLDRSIRLSLEGGEVTVNAFTTEVGTELDLAGRLVSIGDIEIDGSSLLRENFTLDTRSASLSIRFGGVIQGNTPEGENFEIQAGDGNVVVGDIGKTVALGDMVVSAGVYDASGSTTNVRSLTVNGEQIDVGDSTVNASGNVTLSGTNVSGTINGASVTVNATASATTQVSATTQATVTAQNVTAQVTAPKVQVTASQQATVQVQATSQAVVAAPTVVASVTAPQAAVAAEKMQLEANVGKLTVQADIGEINGNIGDLTLTDESGVLIVNGRAEVPDRPTTGQNQALFAPESQVAPVTVTGTANSPAGQTFGSGSAGSPFKNPYALGYVLEVSELSTVREAPGAAEEEKLEQFFGDFWDYYYPKEITIEWKEPG